MFPDYAPNTNNHIYIFYIIFPSFCPSVRPSVPLFLGNRKPVALDIAYATLL